MSRQSHFCAKAGHVTLSYASPIDGHSDSSAEPATKRRRRLDSMGWAPVEGHSPGGCECAACSRPKSQLESLPAELLDRIAHDLGANDVACTLRLLSRTLAAHFRSHTAVGLSLPVPHHAFVRRFGRWSDVRSLSLSQRRKLLALTAASGSVANLRVVAGGPGVTQALGTAGCALTAEVFTAAAAAGQQRMCRELYDLGCPWDSSTVEAAARHGGARLVRALVLSGCRWDYARGLCAAAAGGDWEVVMALIRLHELGHSWSVSEWDDEGSKSAWASTEGEDDESDDEESDDGSGNYSDAEDTGAALPRSWQDSTTANADAVVGAGTVGAKATGADAAAELVTTADAAARAAAAAVDMAALRRRLAVTGLDAVNGWDLLSAAAYGLALQPLAELAVRLGAVRQPPPLVCLSNAVAAALLSPTPDWRAKAEWLEMHCADASEAAASAARSEVTGRPAKGALDWHSASAAARMGRLDAEEKLWLLVPLSLEELMERMSWARRRGYRVGLPPADLLPLADAAAMRAALSWLLQDQETFSARELRCKYFASDLVNAAAAGGHVGVLEALALEQQRALEAAGAAAEGGPSSSGQPGQRVREAAEGGAVQPAAPPAWAPQAALAAARQGQLPLIRWLVATWGPGETLDRGMWCAAASGPAARSVVQFLRESSCPGRLEPHDVATALKGGGGDGEAVLEWLQQQGWALGAGAMEAAAEAGDLRALCKLRKIGCELRTSLWEPAVEQGWVEVVEWLWQQGCALPEEEQYSKRSAAPARRTPKALLETAIEKGDVGMLKVLATLLETSCAAVRAATVGMAQLAYTLRSAVFESPCRSLPLIRLVLQQTRTPGEGGAYPILDGWRGVDTYENEGFAAGSRSSSTAVTAAAFDGWVRKVKGGFRQTEELSKAVEGILKCARSLAVGGLGRGGDRNPRVDESLQTSFELLSGALDSCLERLSDQVGQVMEWAPEEGAEEEDEGEAEVEDGEGA
ncbi:hypothetical protein HXX76_002009 [Chlamydomonas incerta]|uniref:F-box domain-containing protein n=1 Tax=Chlamydomonas incerta TaxID=51695 RepID=A0A836AZY6_CHLIN|nr:hypothetical protein HXX76_002009 [Chlamydomonas incerta]|eukprot:KAG2443660.1 hypothetical protein HXX76_002009 [Chlamydomonas incerta]